MELFLNLAWMLVAGIIMCLWLRSEDRSKPDRRRQLIAMAVLIAILFPVISVSDDLLAMQNASEADNYPRRNLLVPSSNHPVQPALAMMAAVIFAAVGFGFMRFAAPSILSVKGPEHPALASSENRAPPVAA